VGHSQGSVIAHTTLSDLKTYCPTALTTIGSPLGTLYKKYLSWDIETLSDWKNLFRSGDYIGGPVGIAEVDEDIGPGGHTEYWGDSRLLPWLNKTDSGV